MPRRDFKMKTEMPMSERQIMGVIKQALDAGDKIIVRKPKGLDLTFEKPTVVEEAVAAMRGGKKPARRSHKPGRKAQWTPINEADRGTQYFGIKDLAERHNVHRSRVERLCRKDVGNPELIALLNETVKVTDVSPAGREFRAVPKANIAKADRILKRELGE